MAALGGGEPVRDTDRVGERLFLRLEGDALHGPESSAPVGTLGIAGATCGDWTSASADDDKQVGHSDGLGPNMNSDPPYSSWNSAHLSGGCDDTAPAGGAGRIYCFAAD